MRVERLKRWLPDVDTVTRLQPLFSQFVVNVPADSSPLFIEWPEDTSKTAVFNPFGGFSTSVSPRILDIAHYQRIRGDQLNPLKSDPNTARAPLAPTHRIRPVSQPTLPAHVYRTVGSLFTNGQLYQSWSKLCPINCLFLTSVFRLLRTRKDCTC